MKYVNTSDSKVYPLLDGPPKEDDTENNQLENPTGYFSDIY